MLFVFIIGPDKSGSSWSGGSSYSGSSSSGNETPPFLDVAFFAAFANGSNS